MAAKYEFYDTDFDYGAPLMSGWKLGQTFTVGTVGPNAKNTIYSVKPRVYRVGNPGIIDVNIYAVDGAHKPTGPSLASGSFDADTLTLDTNGEWKEVLLAPNYELQPGIEYAIVLTENTSSASNECHFIEQRTTGSYAGGGWLMDTGAGWDFYATNDANFEQYGDPVGGAPRPSGSAGGMLIL